MSRWRTLASMLLLVMGLPVSGRAQSDGWGPPNAGVVPAGWHHPSPSLAHGHPAAYPPAAYGPPGPYASGPGSTTFEQLPDDTGWLYDDGPLERILAETFRHAFFRVEYLLWDIGDPGNNILGSPTNFALALPDPTQPFVETDPVTGNTFLVAAPSLRGVHTNDNNGIRGTFGFLTPNGGAIEASVFALQTSKTTQGLPVVNGFSTIQVDLDGDGIPETTVTDANGNTINISTNTIGAVAQSTLVDGNVPTGDNFFLINDLGYQYTLSTSLWGAECNWVMTPADPGAAMVVSPVLGFRYLNFAESLNQSGQYTFTFVDPITGAQLTQPGNRRIDSDANNNVYGPQFGLRAEMNNRWLSLGVHPKVLLGLNSYKTELNTQEILAPVDLTTGLERDPSQQLAEKGTTFGIIGDLEVYSRIHFSDRVSVFVGYNLMWTGLITRPAENIVYNIQSSPQRSDFGLEPQLSGVVIQGLTVGGEVRW